MVILKLSQHNMDRKNNQVSLSNILRNNIFQKLNIHESGKDNILFKEEEELLNLQNTFLLTLN
jgi:hypothetical protein